MITTENGIGTGADSTHQPPNEQARRDVEKDKGRAVEDGPRRLLCRRKQYHHRTVGGPRRTWAGVGHFEGWREVPAIESIIHGRRRMNKLQTQLNRASHFHFYPLQWILLTYYTSFSLLSLDYNQSGVIHRLIKQIHRFKFVSFTTNVSTRA